MASTNRLTLKIGVVFDNTTLKKETLKAQKQLDKAYEDNIKKQKAMQDSLAKKQKTANKATKEQTTLVGKLSSAFKKTAIQISKALIFMQALKLVTGIIKDAVSLAFELDTAFTNFAIVSKATASEIANVNAQVDGLTLELGKLKKEVIDTVTEFNRAGFSIQESLTLAENAIKGANVGATDLSNVTTFLIAGLKAFNLEAEDSSKILDVLFRVANTTAINLEGIGEAFLRSANTLNTAGASLEESAALIAGANESIQDPAKVGTALKTIASRLRGVSEDGEAIPKLAESFNAVGISIQEADGSFRNIYDIFQDLARILPTLDELTRESLLEKLAGKRQKNIVIGLLNNFDTAEQALKDALNSTGEVAQANEKFLDSLQGRTNQLKEAWNQLLQTFTDSDALKVAVTGLKNLVVGINDFITKTPKAIFLASGLLLIFSPLGAIATGIGVLVTTIASIGTISELTTPKIEKLKKEFAEINASIASLNGNIAELEGIENRTLKEEELLQVYKDQLKAKQDLLEIQEREISKARSEEILDIQKDINKALKENRKNRVLLRDTGEADKFLKDDLIANKEALQENEVALREYQIELLKSLTTLKQGSDQYKENEDQLKRVKKGLSLISGELAMGYGIQLTSAVKKQEEFNDAIEESITLTERISNYISDTSDNYQLLSDGLLELETNGYLTDDMLNNLIDTFGASILETGLAKDAFADYVASNKINTLAEIDRLTSLAEAEIATAKAIIASRNAITFSQQGYSTALSGNIEQVDAIISGAEKNISRLENERKQLEGTDKARKSSTSTTTKQVETLSDLELELKNINFQIDLQNKLYSRTSDQDKQIEINNKLVDLYKQQKDALIEQQKELDEQNKSLKNGEEGYEDYIDESIKLSLAIEDTTGSIVKFTNANKELNKTIEEGKLEDLGDDLETVGESINDAIQKQIDNQEELAKASEKYYDDLISNKEKELEALKEANDARKEQVELEELLQNLQDLRERRNNLLNNKKARIVKDADVGFEFTTDPEELKQVNEDIVSAEKAIDEFRLEQKYDSDVKRLETTIANLEAEAEAEQKGYENRIEEFENFQDTITTEIENGGEIQESTVQLIQDTLLGIEIGSYGMRLDEVSNFISEYNTKIAQLNAQKATVDAINSSIKATEAENSMLNSNISQFNGSSIDTSTTGSTPTSSGTGSKISNSNSGNTNTSTSINNLNVNSNETSVLRLVDDATRFSKLIKD